VTITHHGIDGGDKSVEGRELKIGEADSHLRLFKSFGLKDVFVRSQ
jgi:hypothetical protein